MTDRTDKLSERLLVLRCQTGDEEAYRELVGRFGPRLTYFLRKLIARSDRADDLAQDVWLDVLRQLPRLLDAGAFTTWLYRIAYGKAMLEGRRTGSIRSEVCDIDAIAERAEESFELEDAAQVHLALDQLEPAHREVLVLRFLEELSYDEIGQIVDCPVGTVRSRIYYAKAQLRRLLNSGMR